MPAIVIKDYLWRQTEKKIIIHVPLKGRPKNVDLFAMDNYVKISFPPFILELFLWESVLEEESECTLTDTETIFSLQKANAPSEWPSLERHISKEQKCEFRNKILEKAQSVLESRAKSRREKRQHLQKEAVKVQVNLDTDTLNKIESLRDSHRKAAMQDLEEWRSSAEVPILQDVSGEVQENRKAYRPPLKWLEDSLGVMQSGKVDATVKTNGKVKAEEKHESIVIEELEDEPDLEKDPKVESTDEASVKDAALRENADVSGTEKTTAALEESFNPEGNSSSEDSESDYEMVSGKSSAGPSVEEASQKSLRRFHSKAKNQRPGDDLIDKVLKARYSRMNRIFDEPAKAVPLPRRSGTINVTFSERVFPTPARESAHAEEQEWLSKQAEARRKTGFVVEDLRPEEQDPQWLKDKGDDFFKAGNYLAAISAYTHGIKISDKMTALYVNRSAAHYAAGHYYRCIDDCSKVLELTEPKCESNRVSRARCHARRGAALCKLSAPQHGIPELEAALELDPSNESVKRDLLAVKQYFDMKE